MSKIQHVVLLKFKVGATQETIESSFSALKDLQHKIDGLESFSGGPYSSPEGLNKGFSHGFVMTFSNSDARDTYLPHPEHEKVKQQILPFVDDVIAFDYAS